MTRTPNASTYDDDFFAWTQEQAALLRRLPAAMAGIDVDLEHVAEEIEDLGKRDLREVESYLKRLFEHLIKLHADSGSVDVPHWASETLHFQGSATDAYSPGMRQLLELERLWSGGQRLAGAFLTRRSLTMMRISPCPFTLDELLCDDFDLDAALARLAVATAEAPPARP